MGEDNPTSYGAFRKSKVISNKIKMTSGFFNAANSKGEEGDDGPLLSKAKRSVRTSMLGN